MAQYWYAYDGHVRGPFFETRAEAAAECDEGETPRPIAGDVVDTDGEGEDAGDSDEEPALDDMSHEELKAAAERRGVAADIDLRSKATIREALRE